MSTDARAALADFVAALERHLEVSLSDHDEDDPRMVQAYQRVVDTFEAYDSALEEASGEVTPLDIVDYDEDDDLDDELEMDDDEDDDFDEEDLDDEEDEDGAGRR